MLVGMLAWPVVIVLVVFAFVIVPTVRRKRRGY